MKANKKPAVPTPAVPVPYELADADAAQAVMRGEADDGQQRRFIRWVVETAAATYDFHYYPSERDTAFALGRAFVGQQIAKMTHLNLSALRRAENG